MIKKTVCHLRKSFLTAGIAAVTAFSAHADVLVQWNTTGATGSETVLAPTFELTNIDGLNLSRGTGLTASGASNNFGAIGFTGETTDYISLGLTVADGFSVDLSSLTIATRSSGSGPGSMGLYYSGDGFTTSLYTFTMVGTAYTNAIAPLTLTGLTGSVEFRLIQIGTTSASGGVTGSTGTFRVGDYTADAGVTFTPIQFEGTVAPVPEPGTVALVGLGLGAVLFGIRRRRA